MTSTAQTASRGRSEWLSAAGFRRLMRDYPLIPLVVLLLALVALLEVIRPGIVNDRWIAITVMRAIPIAILAASQTMTMITGGIDLSVGFVATASAFVMATQVPHMDPALAILISLVPAGIAGFASGIGVGIFRVHPLIMTLAVGLVVQGMLLVYQRTVLGTSAEVPEILDWLASGRSFGIPNALLLFIPLALIVGFTLRRTGFGRLLYAIGDNEQAARLSGVRVWQVKIVLYTISGVLAGIGGLMLVGLVKAPTLSVAEPLMLPSVAAAVIGGTSIFGGRGGYSGTIVGALILGVLTSMLIFLQVPEGARRVIFGAIILLVMAAYTRITEER